MYIIYVACHKFKFCTEMVLVLWLKGSNVDLCWQRNSATLLGVAVQTHVSAGNYSIWIKQYFFFLYRIS